MLDLSEIAYGGAVTVTEWWDNKRITDGTITKKELLKKFGFWTYWVVGLGATLCSAFGWWSRQEALMEHLSHGFLYDAPRNVYNAFQSLKEETTAGGGGAVQAAKEIIRQRQAELASKGARGRTTERTYQPEMESAAAF